jgi:hypothetical protein
MFFVDLRIPRHELAAQMGDMRIWLDRQKIETAGFFMAGALARLAFKNAPQAEAFAVRFAGSMVQDPAIRVRRKIRRRRADVRSRWRNRADLGSLPRRPAADERG